MNKITTLAAISMFAVIMGISAFAPALAEPPAKVTICHVDVDEGGDPVTIEVSERSYDAHMAHGDTDGPCV